MSVIHAETKQSDLNPRLIEAAFYWRDGHPGLGKSADPRVDALQLRVWRSLADKTARWAALRIAMEPVLFMDTTKMGAEARVRMFRYQDASGGPWLWSWCGSCGAQFCKPDTGFPILDEGCSVCGVIRSRIDCDGWHCYGECPICPSVGLDLPVAAYPTDWRPPGADGSGRHAGAAADQRATRSDGGKGGGVVPGRGRVEAVHGVLVGTSSGRVAGPGTP